MRPARVAAGVLLALLLFAVALPARRVTGTEMAPDLLPGDIVWILPVTPLRGDVVLLDDPLDPDRTVLRRAVADGGRSVRWDEGGLRIDGKRVRQSDMGMREGDAVMEETIWSKPPARPERWRSLHRRPAVHWTADEVEIPEGQWYLLADDRDRALDSRWWGTVPAEEFHGVVRLRVGAPTPWRGWVEWLQGTE